MDTERKRELICSSGLFRLLTPQEQSRFVESMTVEVFEYGAMVFAEGDLCDALYVVASGRARVIGRDATGQEVSLGVLNPGAHFGEAGIVTGLARSAGVRAAEPLTVLKLKKTDFSDVLKRHPEMRTFVERYVTDLGIQNFLKQFTIFESVPSVSLRRLVSDMQVTAAKEGETIIRQGAPGDCLYVVRKGSLEVTVQGESGTITVGYLGPSEFFGEIALLSGKPRAASVTAKTDCELYRLSAEGFRAAIDSAPALRRRLEAAVASYEHRPKQPADSLTKSPAEHLSEAEVFSGTTGPVWRALLQKTKVPFQFRRSAWRRFLKIYPFIAQHDASDCGAASLAMILKYYGHRMSIAALRDMANVDREGATMWSVAQAAEKLGLHARGLQISADNVLEIDKPAILHWEGFHYVVLYEATSRHVTIGDPAVGLRRLCMDDFRKAFTGRVLELSPTDRLETTAAKSARADNWAPMCRQYWKPLALVVAASALLNLLALGLPLSTQVLIDRVLMVHDRGLLNLLLLAMLGVVILQAAVTAARHLLLVRISARFDLDLMSRFLRSVLKLPMRFFDLRRTGDLISRVFDNERISNALVSTVPGMVMDASLALGYLCLLAHYSGRLTLLVLATLLVFVGSMILFTPVIRRNRREYFAKDADQLAYLVETLTGVATVKSLAVEDLIRERWTGLFVKSLAVGMRGARIESSYSTVMLLVSSVFSVVFLWYGAHLALAGSITVGQLIALIAIVGNITTPVLRLSETWEDVQEVRNALERLNDVLGAAAETEDSKDSELLALPRLLGAVRFEGVSFRYSPGQERPVLANLSFDIRPGETIAVVGRSGSGKTTLAKLILGLYLPDEGRVYMDNHDIRNLNRREIRRRIGVVPQDVFLFSGTIRENVAPGERNVIPFEQVVQACRLAGAHDFVGEMGLGYESKVGERGMCLSGGQRQRIALARALVHNPDILILDEATSALDTETESAIQRNLKEVRQGHTTIVIAHRLSTVQNADRILVLDRGTLVEEGTHEQLLEKGGLYASLVLQQIPT